MTIHSLQLLWRHDCHRGQESIHSTASVATRMQCYPQNRCFVYFFLLQVFTALLPPSQGLRAMIAVEVMQFWAPILRGRVCENCWCSLGYKNDRIRSG